MKKKPVKVQEPKLTETALEVVRKRYLRTDMRGRIVETVGEMLWRGARHMAKAEKKWASKKINNGEKKTYYAQTFF